MNFTGYPVQEGNMPSSKILAIAILIMVTTCLVLVTGCLGNSTSTITPTVTMPQPQVESVFASTSGTQTGYYTTLDIKVKNSGAEGTILVQAKVTQNGTTSQSEMPVFLKQNEEHELKLTFPLVWKGGDFTCNVQAVLPTQGAVSSNNSPTATAVSIPSPTAGSINLFVSQAVSQEAGAQTTVYTFTPAYSGNMFINGTSNSLTSYILVVNTKPNTSTIYNFGKGIENKIPLISGNTYLIYFGNHDTSGTITATLTGTYQP
jgi:hypothetical protein